jgi:hypothetical protein
MKFAALAALCFGLAACQRITEEPFSGQTTLTATIEAEPQTKTAVSPAGDHVSEIIWTEGDEISVFMDGGAQAIPFKLAEGSGTTKGVFHGKGEGSSYTAFYPSSMLPSRSGEALRFTLPFEQAYTPGTFAPGAYPMVAVSGSPDLHFRNLASVIQLSMTGRHPVTRIVFRSNDASVKVSGKGSASLADPANPVLTMVSGACDSLTLSVPQVKLDETKATDFYLVVPAQTYKGGFTVRVYTDARYMDKVYSANFTTVRSRIHKADPFEFQPNGVDISTFLEGTGSAKNPFLIQSVSDLVLVRNAVNAGAAILTAAGEEVNAGTASYLLTADIDLTPACSKESGKSWVPIGNDQHRFTGQVDGNGHRISGLYIKASTADQGLFGVIEAGSYFCNLTVSGDVTSNNSYVSLLSGRFEGRTSDWTLYNCAAEGSVRGTSMVGGLSGGSSYLQVYACINRATVSGDSYVGGISGETYWGVTNCINYGIISGTRETGGLVGVGSGYLAGCSNYGTVNGGQRTGGIVGYQNSGWLTDCLNEGSITGNTDAGGLSGYSRQGSAVWNNVNRGDVSGKDNVGGICGWLSSNSGTSILQNCVNLGRISLTDQKGHAGGICGKNEGPFMDYAAACTADQNYWLYDPGKGLGIEAGIGLNQGVSSNNFALTDAQLKGIGGDAFLYQNFNVLVDALNAWAYDQRSRRELQGWTSSGKDGYPTLTRLPVQQPGSDQAVFAINLKETEVLASGGDFVVEVKSSEDYSVQTPGWVSETSVQGIETDPYTKRHTFRVPYNDSGVSRSEAIRFTNSRGTTLSVQVRQKAPYLTLDDGDIVLSANGGSKRIALSSSLPWTATSDAGWCLVSPASGEGDANVMVKAVQNDDTDIRTAQVVISSADGTIRYTVHVIQSGYKEPGESDWKQRDFVHQSLMMRFTATWCGWCPRMNTSVKTAQELYPDKIQHLALHGGGSDLQFSDVSPLMDQYAIGGFPTGILDGRRLIENYNIDYTAQLIVNAAKETESLYGTQTGADISSTISGRSVSVNVNAYVKKAGTYKITVLLVEDNVINAQSDYENGDHARYVHDAVARMSLTNVLGDSFTTAGDYTVNSFSYSVSVPTTYTLENMRVLVYIQRAFDPGSVNQSGSYGNYFVDNTATAEVGSSIRLALEGSGGGSGEGGGGNEGIVPGSDIDM